MPRGGYQTPSRPAPVSGPGSLSKRTDGGPGQAVRALPNAGYGENKDFQQIQQGAPMEKNIPSIPMPNVAPLTAGTMRPNEPITTGAALGPGAGTEILGHPTPVTQRLQDLQALSEYIPQFERYANGGQASNMMKSFVKYLRSQT